MRIVAMPIELAEILKYWVELDCKAKGKWTTVYKATAHFLLLKMFFVFHTLHAEVSIYAVTDQLTKVLMTKYLCSTDHVW